MRVPYCYLLVWTRRSLLGPDWNCRAAISQSQLSWEHVAICTVFVATCAPIKNICPTCMGSVALLNKQSVSPDPFWKPGATQAQEQTQTQTPQQRSKGAKEKEQRIKAAKEQRSKGIKQHRSQGAVILKFRWPATWTARENVVVGCGLGGGRDFLFVVFIRTALDSLYHESMGTSERKYWTA